MDKRNLCEAERDRELQRLLDAIPVPDDASNSDISSELASNFSREPQSFVNPLSPEARDVDYFGNSVNSTITRNSPVDHIKSLRFDEDSQLDLSRNSQVGEAFTPQQVSKMMNWSKTHITPADGLFPQVSAPSISVDPEDQLFGRSDHATPHESYFNPVSLPLSRATSNSKKESFGTSYDRQDRSSQKTGSDHSKPPRRDMLTYSPSNAPDTNWFYTPGVQPQKRQVLNTSHRSHARSSGSSDFVNQGSALLSLHHVGCQPVPTEPNSLALNRDQVIEDMQKLMREVALLKISSAENKDQKEACLNELKETNERASQLEYEQRELAQRNAELEEYLKLMQAHSQGSLEQFRGRALELARTEQAQLNNYLADREKQIMELKYALQKKGLGESTGAKNREIEDLTMELTRLKLYNSSLTKQMTELTAQLKSEQKHREHLQKELSKASESAVTGKETFEEALKKRTAELGEKTGHIERLQSALKEAEGTLRVWNEARHKEKDEIRQLKENVHVLQCENQDLKHGRTSNTDYEGQMRRLKDSYDQRILAANEQLAEFKAKFKTAEDRSKALEAELAKTADTASDKENIMEKEITIEILTNDRERLIKELELLQSRTEDLRSQAEDASKATAKLKDALDTETGEARNLRALLERERRQLQERAAGHEERQYELNRTIKTLQDELAKTKEEAKVQGEAARQARQSRLSGSSYGLPGCLLEGSMELDRLRADDESYGPKLATFGAQDKKDQGMMTSIDMPMLLAKSSSDRSRSRDYAGVLEAKEIEIDQLFREKQYFEGEAKQLRDTLENLQQALKEGEEDAIKVPCSTQTCADLLAVIREEIRTELEEPQGDDYSSQFKAVLEEQREEMASEAVQMMSQAKAEFNAKLNKAEQDFKAHFQALQNDFEEDLKEKEAEYEQHAQKAKSAFEAEVQELRQRCSDLEAQLSSKSSSCASEAELRKKLTELEKTYKAKLRDLEHVAEMEKLQMTQSLQRSEEARQKVDTQYSLSSKELESLRQQVSKLEELDTTLKLKYEAKSQATEIKHAQELTSLNERLSKDFQGKEAALLNKLAEAKEAHAAEVLELQQDFDAQVEAERRRYKELLSIKESSQADEGDSSSVITEREIQWEQRLALTEKTLKSQFENDLFDKEQGWTAKLSDIQASHTAALKTLDDEIVSLKAKHKQRVEQLKEENLKQKRELEREVRRTKELLDEHTETAKKDAELSELERLNAERKEADRKMKQKTMLLQHKHAKELQDREGLLKLEFEKERADALKSLAETHKAALKAKEAEVKRRLEEMGQDALQTKVREAEIKVRKQLTEQHIVELGRLDMEHLAQRERIREELRGEYEKMLSELRRPSVSQHSSFYDLPVKHSGRNLSLINFQDSVDEEFEPTPRQELLRHADRSNMMIEDLRSRQAFEGRQRSPDKQNVQKLVEVMSDFARKLELENIYKFLSTELEAYLTGQTTKKPAYPEIKALLHGYLSQIVKRPPAAPKGLLSPKEPVRTPREKPLIEFSSDKNFLKYDRWVFIAADKVVEDLEQVKSALLTAVNKQPLSNYPCKSARKATEQRPQIEYRDLVQTLGHLAGEVRTAVKKNMEDSRLADSDEVVRLRLVTAEYRDKLARYETELKNLTVEYKGFILKTNDRIQRLGAEKQHTEQLLDTTTRQLKAAEAKAKMLEDTPVLSPEMLSPEETVQLVISVLKRSSRDSLLSQLPLLQALGR
jgi:hypothetical protein